MPSRPRSGFNSTIPTSSAPNGAFQGGFGTISSGQVPFTGGVSTFGTINSSRSTTDSRNDLLSTPKSQSAHFGVSSSNGNIPLFGPSATNAPLDPSTPPSTKGQNR
ncbi:hypothetical protein PHISCL_08447 [Aspergillus sclerotialis]|uniref:Uncharacterized protein n=1 Tax=Aspergillus sclerotialis TaxID=2070753 RepID=A0A3A2Z7Z2_9EURO|nr:hypothetical protein PHISCL_08447 [Aspergillus sclerotialis]